MDIHVVGDNNYIVGGDCYCQITLTPEAILFLWVLSISYFG